MSIPSSVWTLIGVVCVAGSILGSYSAIRFEWHQESIYSRCIRPAVGRVVVIPSVICYLGSVFLYGALVSLGLTASWSSRLSLLLGFLVSFIWIRKRGLKTYAENVRRAGY